VDALEDELLAVALGAAERAAARHREGLGAVAHATKSSATDPVTEVDRESEDLIVAHVLAARPDDGVTGEEGRTVESTSGVRWIIDPLDGTVNYLYGFPSHAVSIGVEVDGCLTVGVVVDTALGVTYTAVQGRGAWRDGLPLEVRASPPPLEHALVATGFAYLAEQRAEQAALLTGVLPLVRDIRRAGSAAVDMCHASAGIVDAYYEQHPNEWDVAAGTVIGRECGLTVHWDPVTRFVVAAPPPLYGQLVDVLADAGAPMGPFREG
jgi:myo-inositol-1(or 4)-monophosphatase